MHPYTHDPRSVLDEHHRRVDLATRRAAVLAAPATCRPAGRWHRALTRWGRAGPAVPAVERRRPQPGGVCC